MARLGWGAAAGIAVLLVVSSPAAALPERGLSVTPARQFVGAQAGQTVSRTITVADDSSQPMIVQLDVRKFAVSNLSYDFEFEPVHDNHVSFSLPQVALQAHESRTVSYNIALPADSSPGGSYYALFASTERPGANQKFEAASLLYLTTGGQLSYGSGLPASSIDHLVFSGSIPFSLNITNSGNSHFFAYLNASLQRPFMPPLTTAETHLLLPQTTRRFTASVPAPLLPGVYRVTYGYRTEYQPAITRVSRVLYVPPWSVAAFAVSLGLAVYIGRRLSRQRAVTDSSLPPYK